MSTLTRIPEQRSTTLARTRVLSPLSVPSSTITLGFTSTASAYSVRRWSEIAVRLSDWRMTAWISSDRLPESGGLVFLGTDAFHSLTNGRVVKKARAMIVARVSRRDIPEDIIRGD